MFGSTYNGQYEDVKAFNDKVGESVRLDAWAPVNAASCCTTPLLHD